MKQVTLFAYHPKQNNYIDYMLTFVLVLFIGIYMDEADLKLMAAGGEEHQNAMIENVKTELIMLKSQVSVVLWPSTYTSVTLSTTVWELLLSFSAQIVLGNACKHMQNLIDLWMKKLTSFLKMHIYKGICTKIHTFK